MNIKYLPHAIIGALVMLELLSLAGAGSAVPWAILFHGQIILRAMGWYFAAQLGFGLLGLLIFRGVIPDGECSICTKDLKSFIPVYGPPVLCPRCGTWFHENCFKGKMKKCPICFPPDEGGPKIPLDFRDYFSQR